ASCRCGHATKQRSLQDSRRAWPPESGRSGCFASIGEPVDEADPVVLAGDLVHPASDITAQNQRVTRGLAVGGLVGDEGRERNARKLCLLESHLVELRNGYFDGVLRQIVVVSVQLGIPLKKAGFIDEVLQQQIIAPIGVRPDLRNFFQRGDRWAYDVQQDEIE